VFQRYVRAASSYERASTPTVGAQVGGASYYGGRNRTASGGVVGAATCAHRWLPFGTRVLVTNLNNARQAILTVNDRGPFVRGRIVDVSVGAAGILGMLHSGTARVSVKVVGSSG
jgi:rare lipoprotein A